MGIGGTDFPHFQDQAEGTARPLDPGREADIRKLAHASDTPEEVRKALLDVLDAHALMRWEKQNKDGAVSDETRRINELQALVTGLSAEMTRLALNEDECQRRLGEVLVKLRTIENRQKRLYTEVRHVLEDDA